MKFIGNSMTYINRNDSTDTLPFLLFMHFCTLINMLLDQTTLWKHIENFFLSLYTETVTNTLYTLLKGVCCWQTNVSGKSSVKGVMEFNWNGWCVRHMKTSAITTATTTKEGKIALVVIIQHCFEIVLRVI